MSYLKAWHLKALVLRGNWTREFAWRVQEVRLDGSPYKSPNLGSFWGGALTFWEVAPTFGILLGIVPSTLKSLIYRFGDQ